MAVVEIPFIVETNYAGWRLDRYLQQKLGRASRSRVQQLIRDSLLQDGRRRLKASTPVSPGMRIVLLKEETPEPPGLPDRLGILHDDEGLLVVDKPAGLPVHPTARYYKGTVTGLLGRDHRDEQDRRPDPAHRIDRETSGALACGRSPEMTRALKASFVPGKRGGEGRVQKQYLAIVHGHPPWRRHRIDRPLAITGRHAVRIRMSTVSPDHPGALAAATKVEVLGKYRSEAGSLFALLSCDLETGRQHQIRAHLHSEGFPIVGDKIYGSDETMFIRFTTGDMTAEDRERLVLPRHALHSWRLSLPHPLTRERAEIEAPVPDDMAGFLESLENANSQVRRRSL